MASDNRVPPPWELRTSRKTGQSYYYNPSTNQSQWEKPLLIDSMNPESRVQVSHILIKHKDSRRPSSWRNPNITITKEEAIQQLNVLLEQIKTGIKTFEEIASQYSDCSSAKRDGDLGMFGKGQMQKPFEDAAFNLQVGEIGDIVSTDSGVHILKRYR